MSRVDLLNPESCKDCHPKHFEEWASSMHAYAGDDPIFLAMNRRGQRETNGELGDFCVKCHAPMALLEGATTDGLNLAEVPKHLRGVTCYFCHTVKEVAGQHNNPLILADDLTMRGGIANAVQNGAHRTAYSKLHDRDSAESSAMCGSCHDIMTDKLHLERTFSEWKDSIFSEIAPVSCSNCHMNGSNDVVADFEGVKVRKRHDHSFPGVDTALIDWPGKAAQRKLIESELSTTLSAQLCHSPGDNNSMTLILNNVSAGHMFPSGSAQDRRAWVQLVAIKDEVAFLESGLIADDQRVDLVDDPNLWRMQDFAFNSEGEPEHMFWDIARVESQLLPPSVTLDPTDPRIDHSRRRNYPLGNTIPDRVEMVVRLRSIDLGLIDDLVASGDLDPKYRALIPTFDLTGTRITWSLAEQGIGGCTPL